MTLVMKFGGTSVGSAQAMRDTANLIIETQAAWGTVVVVASGMGTRPIKVTDLLLNGAKTAVRGDSETFKRISQTLQQIHVDTITELIQSGAVRDQLIAEISAFTGRYHDLCQAVYVLGELTDRALDAISCMGEQMSVRILAAYLSQSGYPAVALDATELIVTDTLFQNATPLWEKTAVKTKARLQPYLDNQHIPIITGFIGASEDGIPTTLGRGGSDFSGAIFGSVLQANEVWIWTDVDGVMSADPRLVNEARSIPILSYREVSELAFYGARVLHPKSIRPCIENGIPLRIKNTFNPAHPGTVIVPDGHSHNGGIKAVTAIKSLSLLTVAGKGMLGVPGIAARTFGAVARTNISVLLISQASSEQSICFTVAEDDTDLVIDSLTTEFTTELARKDIDEIWAQHRVSIITVVGAGMRGTPGIAGRVFTALGQNNINVIAIAQGSSECSISIVVTDEDTTAAVQHIHALISEK